MPSAPAALARSAFDANVQYPRETSAIEPASEPAGSVLEAASRSPAGPQRNRSTGLPSVPTIVPTSTSFWSIVAQAGGVAETPTLNATGATPAGAETVSVVA